MTDLTIGFLGAGRMASALGRGLVAAGLVGPAGLVASDPLALAREAFSRDTGGRTTADNAVVVRESRVVVVAVKPDQVPGVLRGVEAPAWAGRLVVSIAAGVTLATLEGILPPGTRCLRVMPNTPALVGASASAFAAGAAATAEDVALGRRLLESVGRAWEVKEKLLNAVTGLSGSGPAYAFLMIEALADGGVAAGLPREVAQQLAAQTLLGAARLVLETGQHPGALKDAVCSPGGTTIEAVAVLERAGLRGALISAVRAAADKAQQLG